MGRIQKNERIGVISGILKENPNKVFTLNYFCDLLNCAKSTISEDLDVIRDIFKAYELGEIETISGAAGGVYYNPLMTSGQIKELTKELCEQMNQEDRIIPGGYIYTNDILYCPSMGQKIGNALATMFKGCEVDYIVTIETKGIPLALMAARALNKPMVVVRNQSKLTDGTVIYMNYITGSNHRIKTMCLSTRAIERGSKVLFIDDFMRAGGTARGISDLIKEFDATLVGTGVLIATQESRNKLSEDFKTLLWIDEIDEMNKKLKIRSAIEGVEE